MARDALIDNNKGDKLRLEASTLIEGIREADLGAVEGVFATLQESELSTIANLFQAALNRVTSPHSYEAEDRDKSSVHAVLSVFADLLGFAPRIDLHNRIMELLTTARAEERQAQRSTERNWCAECDAKTEQLSSFMEGWLKVVHERDCQWAKAFAMPLGEHLIFVGSGAFMST